tara:strand:- start:2963 stop:3601 length:639 start_codon:yes stop_codon:yes gene_type:complete
MKDLTKFRWLYLVALIMALALLIFACQDLRTEPQPRLAPIENSGIPHIDSGERQGLAENYENCGQGIAQHPCNFKLQDQYGKSWQLYDHRGSIIVLDFSTMWCGVCMHAATKIENILEDYEGHNIIWVTVLLQDQYGNLPTLDLIKLWARTFEIEYSPVLVGDLRIAKAIVTGEYDVTVLPTMVIIDQEMTIQYIMEGWNEGRFRVYLDSLI